LKKLIIFNIPNILKPVIDKKRKNYQTLILKKFLPPSAAEEGKRERRVEGKRARV